MNQVRPKLLTRRPRDWSNTKVRRYCARARSDTARAAGRRPLCVLTQHGPPLAAGLAKGRPCTRAGPIMQVRRGARGATSRRVCPGSWSTPIRVDSLQEAVRVPPLLPGLSRLPRNLR